MRQYYPKIGLFVLTLFICLTCNAAIKTNAITDVSTTNQVSVVNENGISKATTSQVKNLEESTSNSFSTGFYYGIFAMTIIISLLCFFLFQEKLYLILVGIQVAIATLLLNNDVSIFLDSGLITSITLLSVACISIPFTSKFFSLNEGNILKTIANASAIIASIFLLSFFITGVKTFLDITNILSSAVLISLLVIGVSKFSENGYSKLYVIASAVPIVFVINFYALQPIGVNLINTELFHLKTAFLLQVFLITYTILYRMKSIKELNEIRKIEMQLYIKNQEAMSRKNIESLMQDVYLENLIMNHDLDGMDIKLLQYISEGKNNTKIARKLKVSENDLQDIITELYYKLGVEKQVQEDHDLIDSQPDYIYN
ncbi:7TM diverse intracellular signaling domain-containing protein [Patiriisocius hiemis]|uniref:7TM diverse intracellular signaling domain-containing protein n=1 Tax=Patiriisocius hiemis TaxID=3075604 RepID=A0ABU2Y9Y9_9FLAO|nr:7TM diverse intracellular signaling domain-containing protein [Constantimarinum sp. W242]MDT0555001.1 7TM diverse intracellular signaling domain-containing protein [Constantimarinum sp. W242]